MNPPELAPFAFSRAAVPVFGFPQNANDREIVFVRWAAARAVPCGVALAGSRPHCARRDVSDQWRQATPFRTPAQIGCSCAGLEATFSGKQPESLIVAEQLVKLSPGASQFHYRYQTTGVAPHTGLHWTITDFASGATLAISPDLSSSEIHSELVPFTAPASPTLVRLRLEYQRAYGTPRISGP